MASASAVPGPQAGLTLALSRRRRPVDSVLRLPRRGEVSPILEEAGPLRRPQRLFSAWFILIVGFTLLAAAGGGLLLLPISSFDHQYTAVDTAFFTSVSAITVTGHTVVSTPTYWSPFGQAVIFTLMLVGGLGFMVISTFLLLLIGHRATLQERILTRGLMHDTVGVDQMQGLRHIGRNVIVMVFLLYIAGAAVLFWQIHGMDQFDTLETMWQSLFLAVASFNNSGMSIIAGVPAGNAARFVSSPPTLITMTVLMVLGSAGWVVIVDIYRQRRFSRFRLETKLMVVYSLLLWGLGAGVLFLAESTNGDTMGHLGWVDKVIGAGFQSVSGRTAGFSIIDFGQVKDVTKMAFSGLMFIGGGAGSAAGGIKVVSFAIIVAAVVSSLKGRAHAEAFGREISQSQLHRALTVTVLGLAVIVISMPFLTTLEPDISFLHLFFDFVSALGTTGASTGAVPALDVAGRCIFIFAMIIGRLGPVVLAVALAPKEEDVDVYRFAQERVKIG